MDRLTARGKEGKAYFPECFKEPCLGCGCIREKLQTVSSSEIRYRYKYTSEEKQ